MWDESLCSACASLSCALLPQWELIDAGANEYPLWSLSDYSYPIRSIILAAKHSTRVDLSSFLFQCGMNIGLAIAQSGMLDVGRNACALWVIPAPSSWKRRLFGHPITVHIAQGLASAVCEHSCLDSYVVDVCRLDPWVSSQAGKTSDQRRRSRSGHMSLVRAIPPEVAVIGVDDVVATGGTMNEMFRILEERWISGACIARSRR